MMWGSLGQMFNLDTSALLEPLCYQLWKSLFFVVFLSRWGQGASITLISGEFLGRAKLYALFAVLESIRLTCARRIIFSNYARSNLEKRKQETGNDCVRLFSPGNNLSRCGLIHLGCYSKTLPKASWEKYGLCRRKWRERILNLPPHTSRYKTTSRSTGVFHGRVDYNL